MISLSKVEERKLRAAYERACETYGDFIPEIEKVNDRTYTIQSSNRVDTYTMTLDNDAFTCSCPAGRNDTYCKHHQMLVAWLAVNQPALVAADAAATVIRFGSVYDLNQMTWLELDELETRLEEDGSSIYDRAGAGKISPARYAEMNDKNLADLEMVRGAKDALETFIDSDYVMESLEREVA